jgi:hypothetical protein
MSIRFSVELDDPHTENLLRYLEDALGDNYVHKLEVLECARQWLELHAPTAFNRGESHEKLSLLLVADEKALDAS